MSTDLHAHGSDTDAVRHLQHQPTPGRLVIFLGYAPGVGKTATMLEAAQREQLALRDVVRDEKPGVSAILAGDGALAGAPLRPENLGIEEMDLDAILLRRPPLVLVDNLARQNPAGGRHPRCYQDVEEILAAGIDVYTTLNVGQLESLSDVVAGITGVPVPDTVPDRLLDTAEEVLIVDLAPAEVIRRWQMGAAGPQEPADSPLRRLFRMGNLIALRELMLRRVADRLDDQMRAYMQTRAIPGPWPAHERILVCVSPSPLGDRLVRAGRRLADHLQATWFVVFVETPSRRPLPAEARERVARTLTLAEELGAKALTLPGRSVSEAVLAYARSHNVTKIVAGKPRRPGWQEWLRGSIVDRLIRDGGSIDIYVISSFAPSLWPAPSLPRPRADWRPYVLSIALVTGASFLSELLRNTLSIANLLMIYLFAVLIAAVALGRGPAILASILGVVAFDFLLVSPRYTLAVDDIEYLLTFFGLLAVGILVTELTARLRAQVDTAERRAVETTTLHELSRDLAAAASLETIVQVIVDNVTDVFGRQVAVLLPMTAATNELGVFATSGDWTVDDNELVVARYAFARGQPAGRGSDTLPTAQARHLPMKTARGTVGVLAVKPLDPTMHLTPDQRRLLDAFASLAALAIERANLVEETEAARVEVEKERMRSSLLSSVSHDLRTPLAAITGAASSLLAENPPVDASVRRELTQGIYDEANRLNSLVRNLLDMTRLESGAVHVNKAWQPVEEVIGAALMHDEPQLAGRDVEVNLPVDLPLIPLDEVSIEQVLINLLENAIKYSPAGSPITLSAAATESGVMVEVADCGPGVRPADEQRIFDKFYRAQTGSGGVGLGLAICRGIVEAHGGRIWVENRPGGGAAFRFVLPIEGQPPALPEDISE